MGMKARKRLLEKARKRLREALERDKKAAPTPSVHTPESIYDDVYVEGMKWLDSLGIRLSDKTTTLQEFKPQPRFKATKTTLSYGKVFIDYGVYTSKLHR